MTAIWSESMKCIVAVHYKTDNQIDICRYSVLGSEIRNKSDVVRSTRRLPEDEKRRGLETSTLYDVVRKKNCESLLWRK